MTMTFWAYVLIYLPIALFVLAFLYETYLSFARLRSTKAGRAGYVDTTWETTHTLLVFGVVMMLMLHTQTIDALSSAIFTATFWAAVALGVRGAAYIYIFYIRDEKAKTNWVDGVFALTHIVSAALLVTVVLQATLYFIAEHPPVNTHFIPAFLPGLALVLIIGALPLARIYLGKHGKKY